MSTREYQKTPSEALQGTILLVFIISGPCLQAQDIPLRRSGEGQSKAYNHQQQKNFKNQG